MRYYNPNSSVVERDHDVIYIRKLNHSRVVSEFIKAINDGQKKDMMISKLIFPK